MIQRVRVAVTRAAVQVQTAATVRVNPLGATGALTQSTADGLYDPLGAASAGDAAHVAASDPHPQYLTAAEGDAAYDALGAASAAVAAHEAAPDPHPQYMTSAEVAAAYSPIASQGTVTWTGTQNNVDLSAHTDWMAELTGSAMLAGLVTAVAGTTITLRNTSPYLLVLQMEASTSTAANRLQSEDRRGSHLCVMPGDVVRLVYDGTATRWTVCQTRSLWWGCGRGQVRWSRQTTGTTYTDNQIVWSGGSGTFGTPTPSTASLMESTYRSKCTSGSSSSNVAGTQGTLAWLLPATGTLGGFGVLFGFGFETVPDQNVDAFFGVGANGVPGVGAAYSSLNDIFGFVFDNGDTTWSFCVNDASGTATKTPLTGITMMAKELYRAVLWWDPSQSSKVSYAIWDDTTPSTTPLFGDAAANLPTVGMFPIWKATNRAGAARQIVYDEWAFWSP